MDFKVKEEWTHEYVLIPRSWWGQRSCRSRLELLRTWIQLKDLERNWRVYDIPWPTH